MAILQVKEGGQEQVLPSQSSKGTTTADILILRFWPQNCETIHFCYLSHPVYGSLLWRPQQTNILILTWHLASENEDRGLQFDVCEPRQLLPLWAPFSMQNY